MTGKIQTTGNQRNYKLRLWSASAAGIFLLTTCAANIYLDLGIEFAFDSNLGLSLFFGAFVGFSLGLTGGGGSIFAVPLLIYGLGIAPHQAVVISLAAVGATALVGALQRWYAREIEIGIGGVFALGGVLGTPIGSWVGHQLPGNLLLLLFAGLMILIASRMWLRAVNKPDEARVVRASLEKSPAPQGPACRLDPSGKIKLTAPCLGIMALTGVLTGILSGLFGVGGGFVIVPALIFFSTIDFHRAVATSLLTIALISGSGVAIQVASGEIIALDITSFFVAGGILGMGLGMILSRAISGPRLQQTFAFIIITVALFIAAQNLLLLR